MKLKNKIILILSVLAIFITFSTINVFAATDVTVTNTSGEPTILTIPDSLESFDYIAIMRDSSNMYYVYWASEPFLIETLGTTYYVETDTSFYYLSYNSLTPENITNARERTSLNGGSGGSDTFIISACNFDMTDEDGQIVYSKDFSVDKEEETPTDNTILNKTIDKNSLDGVFSQIIPILPILLVVLIGFIAIRKGLAFLNTTLHNS